MRALVIWLLAATAFGEEPLGSHKWHLETEPVQRVTVTITCDAPEGSTVYFASPPTRLNQTSVRAEMTAAGVTGEPVQELSILRRPLLKLTLDKSVRVVMRIRAVLSAVRLAPGPPKQPPPTLSVIERNRWLRNQYSTNVTSGFRAWLKKHDLTKRLGEHPLDFARRAAGRLREVMTYKAKVPLKFSIIDIAQEGFADCYGISNVYVGILRANGIPSRACSGRTIIGGGETHVKPEFFVEGIGWIPVEIASLCGDPNANVMTYFGRDTGQFLALTEDMDMAIPTPGHGPHVIGSMAGFAIVTSSGSPRFEVGSAVVDAISFDGG